MSLNNSCLTHCGARITGSDRTNSIALINSNHSAVTLADLHWRPAVPILGTIKPGYEVAAIESGKAIMLTQILANCVTHMKHNKLFFAREDLEDCEVDLPRLKLRRPSQGFRYLVRLYVHRIERMYIDGGSLLSHMDYDGKRTLKSLLGMSWKMLMKMKVEPECILSEEGVLSKGELLGL